MSGQPHVDPQITNSGWKIFPCKGKQPLVAWTDLVVKKGKSIKVEAGFNYGVPCGAVNGIFGVDCDVLKDSDDKKLKMSGKNVMLWILDAFNNGNDFHTPKVLTPTGGCHYYFRYDPDRFHKQGTDMIYVKIRTEKDEPFAEKRAKVDARSDNGYLIGPGSIHPEAKKRYKWADEHVLGDDCEIADLPDYLEKLLSGTHILVCDCGEFSLEVRQVSKPIKTVAIVNDNGDSEISPETLQKLVMSLSRTRADIYEDWMKILFAIATCSQKFPEKGLDIADEFSRQSSKYQGRDEVEKMMSQSRGAIKGGTLWHFLKEDNSFVFNEFYFEHREKVKENIYFRDYDLYAGREGLTPWLLVPYLKACIVKIDNNGNCLWLTKNRRLNDKTKQYQTYWELIGNMPFKGDGDFHFSYEIVNEKGSTRIVDTSFSKILRKQACLPGFPRHDRVDFIPYLRREDVNYDEKEIFNLFPGFAYKFEPEFTVDMDLIKCALDHMRKVICNDEESIWNYMQKYFAHMIQKPYESPEVAVIISSCQGTGKTMFFKLISSAMGPRLFREFNSAKDLTRKFNKQLESALMVVGYEAKEYGEKIDMEKLKSMITDGQITIEPKGVDPYNVRYTARHFIISNEKNVMNVPIDDRRLLPIRIDNDKLQNLDYYADLAAKFENPDLIKSFFHYFASLDIEGFNPRKFPDTQLKRSMKAASLPQPQRFVKDLIEDKFKLPILHKQKNGIEIVTTKNLYAAFNQWRTENGENTNTTLNNFKEKLATLEIEEYDKRKKINGTLHNCYVYDLDKWGKKLNGIAKKQSPASECQSDAEEEIVSQDITYYG